MNLQVKEHLRQSNKYIFHVFLTGLCCYIWIWAMSIMQGWQNRIFLNTYPSKPAIIKEVCPSSNYRDYRQTNRANTARSSRWMQLSQNTLITVPGDPGIHPQTQTPNTHLLRGHISPSFTAGHTEKSNTSHTWVSIVLTVYLPNRLKNNSKVEQYGKSVPVSDSRARQTWSAERFSITSYYSQRPSGLLWCLRDDPGESVSPLKRPDLRGNMHQFLQLFL